MNRSIRTIQDRLKRFFLPLVYLLFVGLVLLFSWPTIRPWSYNVELNQVADQTIRASRTVQDTEQTELNKATAEASISQVYKYDDLALERQNQLVRQFFTAIKEVVQKSDADIQKGISSNSGDNSSTAKATLMDRVEFFKKTIKDTNENNIYLSDRIVATLLTSTTANLDKYQATILEILSQEMSKELKQENVGTAKENAKRSLFYNDYTDEEREFLGQFLETVLVSNYIVDEEATKAAKNAARDAVPAVEILEGQVIVQEGEIVDKADMRKLNLLGILNNKKNYQMMIGFLAIISVFIIYIAFHYIPREGMDLLKRRDFEIRHTALATLILVAVILLEVLSFLQRKTISTIGLVFPMAAFGLLSMHVSKSVRDSFMSVFVTTTIASFIFYRQSSYTVLLMMVMFMMISGMLGVGFAWYRKKVYHLKWTEFLGFILLQLVLLVPLINYVGYDMLSKYTLTLFGLAIMNSFLVVITVWVALQYFDLLFEDNSVFLLTELSNPNQPLLKDLILKAPGTYHHSLMVATISANCVEAVGGDSLLARVACYYHDIGKVRNPLFFVENLPNGMENPHNSLTPYESKEILFDHVRNGVKILEEHHLPQRIIDICAQHHGTTLASYFYAEALKENPDVLEEEFRYPGPKPQTKEAAIINIVDSAEAATRAMKQPTIEKVENLVHGILASRIEDKQYVECDITLKELEIVEKMIITSLIGTFHSRIEYPKLDK